MADSPTQSDEQAGEPPVFVNAYDFINETTETPEPFWGTPNMTILSQGGLGLFAGRPGTGKTTAIVDLACHLAAGQPYPPKSDSLNGAGPTPFPVPRPLRIVLIENEGPLELFRDKLRQKLNGFPHEITGYLGVQTWRWGSFSFADNHALVRAKDELDSLDIDLVIGDPLTMLGIKGVGSPEDTRDFVHALRFLGLGLNRAFLLIHHFRERRERYEDELASLSGAWGGHLDTLITLAATHSEDQARLAFPKIRWAREQLPKPIVLGKVYNTSSYEALGVEDDAALLEPLIAEKLQELRDTKAGRKERGWSTHTEIAQHIERRKTAVRKSLENAPHIFAMRTGEEARTLGARTNAVLWGLTTWDDAPTAASAGPPPPNPENSPQDEFPF